MATPITTSTTPASWSPDVHTFAPADVVDSALILTHSTLAGSVDGDEPVVRVAFIDDDSADFTAEGTEIPESDPGLGEVVVPTGKISQLVRVSREQYNQAGAAGMLSESARRAVIRRADEAFLNQAAPGVGDIGPAAGILNVEDIIPGGEVDGDLDALVDLLAQIQTNGGTPSGILLSPAAWAAIRKIKVATGSAQSLLGSGSADAVPTLLGVPVQVSNALTGLNGLVIDRSAIVSAHGPVMVATSQDAYFTSDSVAVRATWRIGQAAVRPDRIGTFTVAAA